MRAGGWAWGALQLIHTQMAQALPSATLAQSSREENDLLQVRAGSLRKRSMFRRYYPSQKQMGMSRLDWETVTAGHTSSALSPLQGHQCDLSLGRTFQPLRSSGAMTSILPLRTTQRTTNLSFHFEYLRKKNTNLLAAAD